MVFSTWIFYAKYRPDGSIENYKACLLTQGFSQIPGLNYSHTFSPVVKALTIRVVLSLVVIHNWKLHQVVVNKAFLHGHLNEHDYMEQPPRFADSYFPNNVCRLKKAATVSNKP